MKQDPSPSQTTEQFTDPIVPLDTISEHLASGDNEAVKADLVLLHPGELAFILESSAPEIRQRLWSLIPAELEGDILPSLHEKVRSSIINTMEDSAVVAAATMMETNDLAEVIEDLSDNLSEFVLNSLDDDHRLRLEANMAYADGTAGRLMTTDVISVRADVTLAVVLRYLRRYPSLPKYTDNLMVTNEQGIFLGTISVGDAVTGNPEDTVEKAMHLLADWITADGSEQQVAEKFERRDLISLAVVDDDKKLLGRITVDEAINIIRTQADHSILASAGLNKEEDLFAPVIPSVLRRGLWLGINLVTVFLAAWVIGRFEEALDKIVALAVLMPIVASMGGIAGGQTLTLTIRAISLGQISSTNLRWLTNKELAVGLVNGIGWSIVVALVTYFWFQQLGIALIIAAAMTLNLVAAALSGVAIPVILDRLGIDPAISGAVVLTTVTDIIGFLSFLGLATLFLL
ncbi:MAG: magnesium transporter [Chromatiales bacterium]|nr:magnesium transporter [Chromatiales bacterium]